MVSMNQVFGGAKSLDPFARPNIRDETRSGFGLIMSVFCVVGLAIYVAFDIVGTPITTVVQQRASEGRAFLLNVTCNPQPFNGTLPTPGMGGCWVSTTYKTEPTGESDVISVNKACRDQAPCIYIPEDTSAEVNLCYSDDQIDGIRVAWRVPSDARLFPFGFSFRSSFYTASGTEDDEGDYRRVDKQVRVANGVTLIVPTRVRNDTVEDGETLNTYDAIPISVNTAGISALHLCAGNTTYDDAQTNLTYGLLRIFPNYQSIHAFIEVDELNVIGNLGGTWNIFFAVGLVLVTLYRVAIVNKCGKGAQKKGPDGNKVASDGNNGGVMELMS